MVAAYRGRASAREYPLCADPWALGLAGEEGLAIARAYDEVFPHMELWIAVRTAFLDGCVRRFAREAEPRQVVLLGAGFDARAARLSHPGLRFFEVDQPSSQGEKLRRLAGLGGYPRESAAYVTCDFEREDFLERLEASGAYTHTPTLFVWEGVTAYLTEGAVRGTLRRIAEGTHPESVVAFDHLRKKIVAGNVRDPRDLASRSFVADLGEPLRFGVDDPLPLLYEAGFRRVRTHTFDELALDSTGTYARERAFRFQGLALASRAASDLG
ncbi:MAG: class I SAM-dependent methyltransferase [Deltaproteobacteria bacterium]|nr:class I SAM-dependent methyltransferase [Deltaproteobacteria bacterium]